jgi:DUF2934 family protein
MCVSRSIILIRSIEVPRAKVSRSKTAKAPTEMHSVSEPVLAPQATIESEIRQRAYELYEQRGRLPGLENQDWLDAEREVLDRHSMQSA